MSSEITYQYLLEEKSDSLYDEANLLASTYSDIYQGKNISLSTANPQLQAVATYLKAQAWVINQKGSVVAETSPAISAPPSMVLIPPWRETARI